MKQTTLTKPTELKFLKATSVCLLFTIFAVMFAWPAFAFNKTNRIKVTGTAVHFLNIEERRSDIPDGYFKFPVTPGFEFILLRQLGENTEIGTGINYQTGRIASDVVGIRRYYFTDLAVPLILRRKIRPQYYKNLYLTAGVYFGRNIYKKLDNFTSFGWEPCVGREMEREHDWQDNNYFGDLYLDLERKIMISNNLNISFAPFAKYRIDKAWYGAYTKRTHFGMKLNVLFNF